jgi:hypothetical protein
VSPEELLRVRSEMYGARNGTHLPLLASVIAIARPGPVLEVGTGHCSSVMIAEMCKAMGREWRAVDTEREWAVDAVADLGPAASVWIPDYDHIPRYRHWSVAFVDCSPGEKRLPVVQALRGRTEFIVVHDTDNVNGNVPDLIEALEAFPHKFTYKRMFPWTTVVSNVRAYPGGGT